MIKIISIFCLVLFFVPAFSQLKKGQIAPAKVPSPSQHYQTEYTFDVSTDPVRWTTQKHGLNASFATTDQLFMRSEVPLNSIQESWEETGWKGERLNAQILVWSPDSLEQVRFISSDLTDGKGNTITRENIDLKLVRYVLSNYPYGAANAICDVAANDTAYLMPDRFEKLGLF